MSRTPRARRLLIAAVSLALGLGTLSAAGATSAAQTGPAPDRTQQPRDNDLVGATCADEGDGGQTTVTLITGDRAVATVDADGMVSATLQTEEPYVSRREGDALYLIPMSAQPEIDAGVLDEELFNVALLVEAGYDDESREDIPLIVEGKVPAVRGLSARTDLASIGATATSIDKRQAGKLVDRVDAGRAAGTRIWLDAPVTGFGLDPATGVAQTGAPAMWKQGYTGRGTKVAVLDSGVDAGHPDLEDRVARTHDLTGEGESETDVTDNDGHGTHVASTVAGTGAASGGDRRGMARGADLLIGKVLGFNGGQASWIIAGMEWAVDQRADVVNMSLGSQAPSDCTDPISRSANRLSKQSKTLFVVAAGNLGNTETVSSPGCAAGVLTVGAVDSTSELAIFSSRGPTLDQHNVKPNLTAPGVGTVGAAAGSYGDIHYTEMSGTSMASPHVAGAAALLRDAHPRWSAQRLRQALVAGVKPTADDTVYESGAGELNVARALKTKVTGTDAVLLGNFAWPHAGHERATRPLTFTNTSKRKLTLRFKVTDLQGADGSRMPAGALQLGRKQVTLKPGKSVKVPVTARDVRAGIDSGAFGGIGARVVATTPKGAVLATSTVGYWLEPKSADLAGQLAARARRPHRLGGRRRGPDLGSADRGHGPPRGVPLRLLRPRLPARRPDGGVRVRLQPGLRGAGQGRCRPAAHGHRRPARLGGGDLVHPGWRPRLLRLGADGEPPHRWRRLGRRRRRRRRRAGHPDVVLPGRDTGPGRRAAGQRRRLRHAALEGRRRARGRRWLR